MSYTRIADATRWPIILSLAATFFLATGALLHAQWRETFADTFNGPTIGPNWRWTQCSGRHYIAKNRLNLSHTGSALCQVPLPHGDMRVEFDLLLPEKSCPSGSSKSMVICELRGGEVGGGGADERLIFTAIPQTASGEAFADPTGMTPVAVEPYRLDLDRTYRITMQIVGNTASIAVDGVPVQQGDINPAHSETNRFFVLSTKGMNSVPGSDPSIANFAIHAGPNAISRLPTPVNAAESNARATVFSQDFIEDATNPGPDIQKAIDSLPPTGGLVLLPAGEIPLRRHLRLRDNVTLQGQGAGRTILKCEQGARATIASFERRGETSILTVDAGEATRFKPGDGVCYGEKWGHPGSLYRENKDCVVTAVSASQITVRGVVPETDPAFLHHFFPAILALAAEFVEVKDLTISGGDGGWGGFEAAAVTFGQLAGSRISRVHITNWNGDGLSLQTGADAIWVDNTVTGTYQGYHPGTITQRFLWSRNLGVGNRSSGLYFCYQNTAGIYHRGTVDRFDGLGWPHDIFNVISRNDSIGDADLAIEQSEGGGGIVFNNRAAGLRIGHGREGAPTFDFLVARNRADKLTVVEGKIERCLLAGNVARSDAMPPLAALMPDKNAFSPTGAELDLTRYPAGCDRTEPVDPPHLPEPVLDARALYQPGKPDAGFQAGLDQLAENGGTLLLPAGRYALGQPLTLPSGVTLAGRGLATVLHAATPGATHSLIVAENAPSVTVRDLVLLGEYERRAYRSPALAFADVANGAVIAVDVRGWEGTGLQATGGAILVRDSRILGCAGVGLVFNDCAVTCESSIVREAASGIHITRASAGSFLEACIVDNNRGPGIMIEASPGMVIQANCIARNNADGIAIRDSAECMVIANMFAENNQSGAADGCGLRLAGTTSRSAVHYNNFQDNLMQPVQLKGIVEESSATDNTITHNLGRALLQTASPSPKVNQNLFSR